MLPSRHVARLRRGRSSALLRARGGRGSHRLVRSRGAGQWHPAGFLHPPVPRDRRAPGHTRRRHQLVRGRATAALGPGPPRARQARRHVRAQAHPAVLGDRHRGGELGAGVRRLLRDLPRRVGLPGLLRGVAPPRDRADLRPRSAAAARSLADAPRRGSHRRRPASRRHPRRPRRRPLLRRERRQSAARARDPRRRRHPHQRRHLAGRPGVRAFERRTAPRSGRLRHPRRCAAVPHRRPLVRPPPRGPGPGRHRRTARDRPGPGRVLRPVRAAPTRPGDRHPHAPEPRDVAGAGDRVPRRHQPARRSGPARHLPRHRSRDRVRPGPRYDAALERRGGLPALADRGRGALRRHLAPHQPPRLAHRCGSPGRHRVRPAPAPPR